MTVTSMDDIRFRPIGTIATPYTEQEGMPIQSRLAGADITGTVTVFPEFAVGLRDLDGFSHCYLLYYFHRSPGPELTRRPFLDPEPKGIFSIRHFNRPNPIGFSVVRILGIRNNVLTFSNVDILDGTPLLDIKPYVPDFDIWPEARKGWTEGKL